MVNFKEDEQLKTLNHSCAHVMAQAIKHLYPQAKFWVGPVVAEGFYYARFHLIFLLLPVTEQPGNASDEISSFYAQLRSGFPATCP